MTISHLYIRYANANNNSKTNTHLANFKNHAV
jgi:hypothetical protein